MESIVESVAFELTPKVLTKIKLRGPAHCPLAQRDFITANMFLVRKLFHATTSGRREIYNSFQK